MIDALVCEAESSGPIEQGLFVNGRYTDVSRSLRAKLTIPSSVCFLDQGQPSSVHDEHEFLSCTPVVTYHLRLSGTM